ncbi:hypothetical protein CJD_2852 [Clostridium perfringens D str. JGS1721]|uniref:Uncharacterized protein n=1 Tax=Clostridium perfringens D str. JGS1721 TaxID=488537 RepID=B1V7X2_CLOPF|nr:hypothetical protein CJD_2852 [Clostridium perfringens D str. JGS1721]
MAESGKIITLKEKEVTSNLIIKLKNIFSHLLSISFIKNYCMNPLLFFLATLLL